MVDRATAELLEGGSALIVGAVTPEGEPYATRGWGLTLLPDDGGGARARLLLAAGDAVVTEALGAGGAVAVTAADVPTLRSVQIKGRSLGLVPATDGDRVRARRYIDGFFGDIVATDGTPRPVLDGLVPADYLACTVTIDELYDQTPGPDAGAHLADRAS